MLNGMKRLTLKTMWRPLGLLPVLWACSVGSAQNTPTVATATPGQVLVTGTVPDDVSKLALLTRVREIYGADKVGDQLSVGAVVMPPNWTAYVQKLITPGLRQVNRGQLKVDGNVVSVRG